MPRHRNVPQPRHLLASLVATLLLAIPSPTFADTQAESQQKLEDVQGQITESEAKARAYEEEIAQARQDYAALQKQLVALAEEVQLNEQQIIDTQDRLNGLQQEEQVAAAALKQQSEDMAETLAAMQRLSQRPTALLMAKPESIDTMARTAVLLDAILPALEQQAAALREQISVVETVRGKIRTEQADLRSDRDALEGQRADMNTLLAAKAKQQDALSDALKQEKDRIIRLSREAKSLAELIAGLELEKQDKPADFADIGRPIGGLPFKQARGNLPMPVKGKVITKFNARMGRGARSKGIRVETRDLAQVVSPWDGKIVFAGPFRDYGQLLIIAHGDGYHSLLAGLGQIEVDIAQWVLAGEPVGQMRSKMSGDLDASAPSIYIELRKSGRSIDPLPWIATAQRKVK